MHIKLQTAATIIAVFASGAFWSPLRGADPKPDILSISVERPAQTPTLKDVNENKYKLTLTIRNISKQDVVIWPFAEVQVFDRNGTPVPYAGWVGRFGGRDEGPLLEALKMEKLKPGQAHKIEIGLGGYQSEEKAIMSWKLPSAGEFAVGIRYRFDRARVKKDYAEHMPIKRLDDEKMPWNRAVEIDKSIAVPLVVK